MTVKLTEEMRERLIFVSESLGQSPATVASFAIGQYVALQFVSLNSSKSHGQSVIDALTPVLENLFSKLAAEEPVDPLLARLPVP